MRILFAGGGTGGHLFPAIAIADALRRIDSDCIVSFVGTRNKIEARVVPQLGYEFDAIWISGLSRSLSLRNLLFPCKVLVSMIQSLGILGKRKPDVVVGTGGYVCGPVLIAAAWRKIPTLLQEQNSYPGATTRMLAPRVDEVHITFESSRQHLAKAAKIVVSGTPVRQSLARIDKADACRAFNLQPERRTAFVFGGSQGASSINRAVRSILPQCIERGVQVIWQTGEAAYREIADACAPFSSSIVVRPFIDDMQRAYSAADLAVCRAGATTIAECAAFGLPALFIPYPFAAANHQVENARTVENLGGGIVIEETNIASFAASFFDLIQDEARLSTMAAAMKRAGAPDAADRIARAIVRLAKRGRS